MADTWQTIEQAAVALDLSVRTVNRHITAGKLQSRLYDGRREVLVCLPDSQPPPGRTDSGILDDELSDESDEPSNSPTIEAEHAASDVPPMSASSVQASATVPKTTLDAEMVLALAENANANTEVVASAYQMLARSAESRANAVSRSARVAWVAVALMAVGVTVAVGWTTRQITRAQLESEHLKHELSATTAAADSSSAERDNLRTQLTAAREQAARAEGRLSVIAEQQSRPPTTRPTLTERLTSLFQN